MNQQNLIFENCEECGKELNDMEKKYCREKLAETNYFYPVCSLCLEKEHDGKWPISHP